MTCETPAPLRALLDRVAAAFQAGDAVALAGLYTSDAVFVPADAPVANGAESIKRVYEGVFDQCAVTQTVSVDECLISGDWAFARGGFVVSFRPKSGGDLTEVPGNWMILHAIQPDGSWKIARHMWNAPPVRAV